MKFESCHRCEHRSPPPYSGVMACAIDGRDIISHDDANYCPRPDGPRFGDGIKPKGWDDLPIAVTVNGKASAIPDPLSPDARRIFDAECGGLGDEVEAIAKAIGADKLAAVIEELTGWNCGCDARKRLLNRLPGFARLWGWLKGG